MPEITSIPGVAVDRVEDGSIAQEVGIEPGDRLLSIDRREVEDALDYRFLSSLVDRELTLKVAKKSGELWDIEIEKRRTKTWGSSWSPSRPGSARTTASSASCTNCPAASRFAAP